MYTKAQKELRSSANHEKAKLLARFFKTGKGQYAEGDVFLGVMVPTTRNLVRKYARMEVAEVQKLLQSKFHEERLLALFILVEKFQKGDAKIQEKIFKLYLKNTKHINNWDLVDLTAPKIVGAFLQEKPKDILLKLAVSKNLWERRIAILATFQFIYHGKSDWALKIAEKLLHDEHDLIHKAVGWMLREIGKRCSQKNEEEFLQKHIAIMPRTTLRYAIERFEEKKRQYYLKLK
ncbi:MAG: DNA alkylation repair protein [Candidatus Moranbacteria bacterium]|nr:DNA alkylation repair protein [Candidatus Moranbacteria bacterium]